MGTIRVGTCAFQDHANFYPPSLKPAERLAYYARHFSVVEIDATFYAPLSVEQFRRFDRVTPDRFRFGVKAWRRLTHHDRRGPPFPPLPEELAAFLRRLDPLRDSGKLAYVLFQFPPWFRRSPEAERYLAFVAAGASEVLVAVEFRHRSWWLEAAAPRTTALLRDLGLVHVVADEPQVGYGSVPFLPLVTRPELSVFRLHGRNGETWSAPGLTHSGERFRYRYSRAELEAIRDVAQFVAADVATVHVLFNNNHRDDAVTGARELAALLGEEPPPATLFGSPEGSEPHAPV